MKKLMMLVMALVFAAAFVPYAHAAESAQLGLQVTFAVDQDLEKVASIKAHIEGIAAETRGQCQTFDADGDGEFTQADVFYWLKNGGDFNRDGKVDDMDRQILHEAIAVLKGMAEEKLVSDIQALKDILVRRPDLASQIKPVIDRGNDLYTSMRNYVDILAKLDQQPVISIELNESYWKVEGVKLNSKVSNFDLTNNFPIHMIKNTGTVPVFVDIGYGPFAYLDNGKPVILPGLAAGLNRFATAVQSAVTTDGKYGWAVIPPDGKVKAGRIAPNDKQPLGLVYYSPTELSADAPRGMSAIYELRAYPLIVIAEDGK